MSNTKIQDLFEKALLEEEFTPNRVRPKRRRIDPAADKESFEQSLDNDTDPADFETEGFKEGASPEDLTAKIVGTLKGKVDRIEEMVSELNGTSSEGGSLNSYLASIDKADSVGSELSGKLRPVITKATIAIRTVQENLNAIIGASPALERKIAALTG